MPDIFDFRNTFAAHTPNRRDGKGNRSYILCRSSLNEDKIKGHSSTNPNLIDSKEGYLPNLVSEWDTLLIEYLISILKNILNKTPEKHTVFLELKKDLDIVEKGGFVFNENGSPLPSRISFK
jgi:hypothetical protein